MASSRQYLHKRRKRYGFLNKTNQKTEQWAIVIINMSTVCCPSADIFLFFLGPCLQFLSRAYMTHSTENFVIKKVLIKLIFTFFVILFVEDFGEKAWFVLYCDRKFCTAWPRRGCSAASFWQFQLLENSKCTQNQCCGSRMFIPDPGCLSRIPDPDFYPFRIPDPKIATKERGWKKNLLSNLFL